MGPRQLAEHHGHKLGPTAKAASVPLRLMIHDEVLKLRPRKQFQKLTENAGKSYQGDTFLLCSVLSGNRYQSVAGVALFRNLTWTHVARRPVLLAFREHD